MGRSRGREVGGREKGERASFGVRSSGLRIPQKPSDRDNNNNEVKGRKISDTKERGEKDPELWKKGKNMKGNQTTKSNPSKATSMWHPVSPSGWRWLEEVEKKRRKGPKGRGEKTSTRS